MRLDALLVQRGLVTSRHRAKYAIQNGMVKVAGKVVDRPAHDVRGPETVEVAPEADKPLGYRKLEQIDDATGLFRGASSVLDLGSSGGGFLLYAAERCPKVVGIELSREFEAAIERVREEQPHVEVVWGNAFEVRVEGTYDLLLNDLTLEIGVSLEAAERFVESVALGGKVLQVVKWDKSKYREEALLRARAWLVQHGFATAPPLDLGKRETYLVGMRASSSASSSGVSGPSHRTTGPGSPTSSQVRMSRSSGERSPRS
jgi:23S rRNA (cytidine1920-2'-O)/16S rRNA (cytidine1409-2'-O)-methyltransferase